jgi:hypothetical protein
MPDFHARTLAPVSNVYTLPRARSLSFISDLSPVVTITFSAGALHGEFHFVTDQSCLTRSEFELAQRPRRSLSFFGGAVCAKVPRNLCVKCQSCMKTTFNISVLAVWLAVAPSPCFALWDLEIVSRERAKELGMEVRSTAAGSSHVRVELEFKAEGVLKNFSHVDLRFGQGDNFVVAAPLREDRSKPGRVTVSFTADSAQLDKLTLRVMVPFRDGGAGGSTHELRVKDFVEVKNDR